MHTGSGLVWNNISGITAEEFCILYWKYQSIKAILCTPLPRGLSSWQLFMFLTSLPDRDSSLANEEIGKRDGKWLGWNELHRAHLQFMALGCLFSPGPAALPSPKRLVVIINRIFTGTAICYGVVLALKCSAFWELSAFIKLLIHSETLIVLLMFHLRSGREKNCYFYF